MREYDDDMEDGDEDSDGNGSIQRKGGARGTSNDPFRKGRTKTGGREKGTPNRVSLLLKEAIVRAAELTGEDKRGRNGLVGYLKWLARNEPKAFSTLLGRTLPYQVNLDGKVDHTHREYRNEDEIKAELEKRGIPVDRVYHS